MDTTVHSALAADATHAVEANDSAVHWGAVLAGGLAAAALSLVLLAFGAGAGFSAISPWTPHATAATFKISVGIYFLVTATMSSAVGGYLAGRLRTRWSGAHTREVFFRDTAHGLLAWAFATVLSIALLAAPVGALLGVAGSAIGGVTSQSSSVIDAPIDAMLRPAAGTNLSSADRGLWRSEAARVFGAALEPGGEFSADDRAYLARVVAASAGISQADAEQRVAAAIDGAKQTMDKVRKAAAQLSLWLAAALLMGAFSASLAAIEGGGLRDDTWHYNV